MTPQPIKKLSPLQRIQQKLNDTSRLWSSKEVLETLINPELPKEQQLFSDIWEAGVTHTKENWYGKDERFPDKETYLSQFKQD